MDLRRILYFAVPNGGWRNKITAARLKRTGTKAGVPDLLIIDYPPKHPCFVGTAIEMKRAKGGKVSDAQERWMRAMEERGWLTMVCRGADEAIRKLTEAGY
jgi:hypothetical protein